MGFFARMGRIFQKRRVVTRALPAHLSTDRYGGAWPDPKTVCAGQCEGVGYVPIHREEKREPWRTLWLRAEHARHAEDGWHFVRCPTCGGDGRRPAA